MERGIVSKRVSAGMLALALTTGVMTTDLLRLHPAEARLLPQQAQAFSPTLIADVAEQVAPSVVNIDVERTTKAQILDYPAFPFNDEMLQRFFGFNQGTMPPFMQFRGGGVIPPRTISGNGSGMILNHEGYILTNNHVVSSADKIIVTLQDGRKFPARIIGRDGYSDLAVLKIDAPNLQPAVLGTGENLRPGEWVIAVGSPLGFDHTVTLGIISAISRRIPDLNSNVEFIQTDAAINPGNSGGPLVNLRGEVIGINTAISGKGQNIGFAIPVNVVKSVADALIQDGKIVRPWIGISMTELTPDISKSLGLPEATQGVVVAQVLPGSPAAKAGLKVGDVIQRIDGQVLKEAGHLQEMVRTKPIHSPMSLQILRNGQLVVANLQTEQLPDQPLAQ